MAVTVVQIRIVRVLVTYRLVPVPVGMRFGDRAIVSMLMVCVVTVEVIMFQRLMQMRVVMALGKVQPKPECH